MEIKIDLRSMMGSKLSRVLRARSKLVLSSGSTLNSFSCGGQNRLRFCVRAENYLVLIYGSKLTRFLARGSKLTWF